MINTIDEILDYIEDNPDYKAVIGIIKTQNNQRPSLAWAAIHQTTKHQHIPYLPSIKKIHAQAKWEPLTPKALYAYLRQNKQTAVFKSINDNSQKNVG